MFITSFQPDDTGPLSVNTDFEGANAILLKLDDQKATPEVHFAVSPEGGPETIWFNLKINLTKHAVGQKQIRCVLHFFETLLGNHIERALNGFNPVYKTQKTNWTRIKDAKATIGHGKMQLVEWLVPADEGEVQVALTYPYTTDDAKRLLDEVSPAFESCAIGLTENGRPLNRFFNHPKEHNTKGKPGIYCLARQHAAETPGSWVMEGFLREMSTVGSDAPLIWSIPFVNYDGCYEGIAGKDSFPWDFNRAWGSKLYPKELQPEHGTHPMRHEVKCIQTDMLRWKEHCQPQLVIDFHAPTTCDDSGIFLFLRDITEDGQPTADHAPWVESISTYLKEPMRSKKFIRSGRYPSRWSTARLGDFATRALNLPMLTIETPYAASGSFVFTKEDYLLAGQQIAKGVLANIQ